jgi:hypothetical protein
MAQPPEDAAWSDTEMEIQQITARTCWLGAHTRKTPPTQYYINEHPEESAISRPR